MTEGVIFDLDGILIDSEPMWKKAEQKVFKSVGLNLTDEMCRNTTGLDNMSTVKYWFSRIPWSSKSPEQVADEIADEVMKLISEKGVRREGVDGIIRFFEERNIPMGVASSSGMKIIQAVLEKLKLKDKFAAIHSSEFEEFGKPHPGVYLSSARLLRADPEKCLAFEDSFYGALAAKAARMKVVIIPDEKEYDHPRFGFADLRIRSFREFTVNELNKLQNRF